MRYKDKHQLAAEWQALHANTSLPIRRAVAALIDEYHAEFADHFYRTMLADPHGQLFLSNDQVKERLEPSMQRWLLSMFSETHEDFALLVDQQEKIGQIHARVDIPINLVLGGARHLKQAVYARIQTCLPDAATKGEASIYVFEHIDMAMEIMSHAYSVASDRNARTEEAYKLFTLTQSIGDERERQRSALLNWENALMYALAIQQDASALPTLGASEFGLWYFHKACHAFGGVPEIETITQNIRRVDSEWIGQLASAEGSERLEVLGSIRDSVRGILMLLDDVLKRASRLEAGRDSLTRLLNRKFLPVVLGREVEIARQSNQSFALLMLDIDHFKSINDHYGHECGDHVLQQVASILERSTRGGDYVFRMGGEEFLVVQVNSDSGGSRLFAERLRRAIAKEPVVIGADTLLDVTVSVGVALFDGHPDYEPLIQRADEALYRAKRAGRNRVVVAGE